jgi:hypothetical protein
MLVVPAEEEDGAGTVEVQVAQRQLLRQQESQEVRLAAASVGIMVGGGATLA